MKFDGPLVRFLTGREISFDPMDFAVLFALLTEHEMAVADGIDPGLISMRIETRLIFLDLNPEETEKAIKRFVDLGILKVDTDGCRGYRMPYGDDFLKLVGTVGYRRLNRERTKKSREKKKVEVVA